ncbi:hypothetical protein A8W25_24865 [Streptomyces sp. ERV7]|uniref:hypothetical protein n=1 Tax=Streptomyces sp. ERV7 TaxID=1322334 RepID=UPI0007F496AA|nr:hypothetical protein [Streptomyces sp. ERV7]OAR22807.1 hypothetical protein A8W25_24865 [Streptomyces sp. ERV7]
MPDPRKPSAVPDDLADGLLLRIRDLAYPVTARIYRYHSASLNPRRLLGERAQQRSARSIVPGVVARRRGFKDRLSEALAACGPGIDGPRETLTVRLPADLATLVENQ